MLDLLSLSALHEHDKSLVFQVYIGSTNPSDPHTLLMRQLYSAHLSYFYSSLLKGSLTPDPPADELEQAAIHLSFEII